MSKPPGPTQLTGPMIAECSTWLSIVSQLFSNRMGRLLEPHGLTLGQFSILHHVARQRLTGGNRVSEIAAAVEVGQPAVTKALAKFHNMGLVQFGGDTADKRSKFVTPKPAAAALLDQVYKDIGPELFQLFNVLEVEQVGQFTENLKQLANWLDKTR